MNADIEAIYPLSPMQEGILFHTLASVEPGMYFVQKSWPALGQLDPLALREAWRWAIDRHPILRTSFAWKNRERPLQIVHGRVALPWTEKDWRGISETRRREQMEELLREDRESPFDFARPPLMRFILVRTADDAYEFVWSHHHILLDGWSAFLALNDVFAAYEGFSQGREPESTGTRPFRDYIAWLGRQDPLRAEAFWKNHLRGFAGPMGLPIGKSIKEKSDGREKPEGSADGLKEVRLSSGRTKALKAFASRNRVTLSVLLQGAWALLLSHLCKRQDVVFGVVVSGRPADLEGVESMVGLFINTLPLRVMAPPAAPIVEWLKEVQARQLDIRQFEYTPLYDVQRYCNLPGDSPLFETIVVFENYPGVGRSRHNSDKRGSLAGRAYVRNNYPITIRSLPGAELPAQILYDARRFDEGAIETLLGHLESVWQCFIDSPACVVSDVLTMLACRDAEQKARKEKQVEQASLGKFKSARRKAIGP